jgi:DNA-binding GntR family transcriptional regulator
MGWSLYTTHRHSPARKMTAEPSLQDRTPAPAAHPAEHKLLSRTVADWLADRIIAGVEPPGTRLTETRVAERAGVSRSPVREALRILAREGLVELVPRFGAQVARIGVADVRELYACRMLLEPRCAGLAVEALGPEDVAELQRLRTAMEHAVADRDPQRFLARNISYFRTLVSHCPNGTLRELVEQTWNKAVRYWSVFARLPRYGEGSLARHRALHEAVVAGDGAAAEQADRAILEWALREIIATFAHGSQT